MSGFIGRALLGLALLNVAVGDVYAQARPAPAQLTPLVASDATPGGEVRAALRVLLPEGLHANANKPRDPLLQAMQLTATPPAGIGLEEIVWPKAIELAQAGEKTQETLELVKVEKLDAKALAEVRANALKLEKSAYKNSKKVYAKTSPLEPVFPKA